MALAEYYDVSYSDMIGGAVRMDGR